MSDISAFDVFNGDADGICALHQLRMAEPRQAHRVTGVKRDIALLQRVPTQAEARVTVLDISLDRNAEPLRRLLHGGAEVDYIDHHAAHQRFHHPRLRLTIDESPELCTSLLVDQRLQGRYRLWAITAAFGDNLQRVGRELAQQQGLDEAQTSALARLGQLLNYNAYGEAVSDLLVPPERLYQVLHGYENPFDFVARAEIYQKLEQGFVDDERRLGQLQALWRGHGAELYLLPGETWARRLCGSLANRLMSQGQARAIAVVTRRSDGDYLVSLRTSAGINAEALCSRYLGGGGRVAAAGIDRLPLDQLEPFIDAFSRHVAQGAEVSDSAYAALR
ncbi:DHHA1 domain-containing protein [Paucibacter sp. APW11]|uniref:DHHA1 domain-containing protein n=1 Tax=Roseateles aquae TaxID=3077235 RepID=A0ABU3PB94_9BURK|nr:DHHA1 domain-containing protein [Paucibacter sp. APW11]MDT8999835.1 DHHA1 domain-containing protein [Paucibacter sp. APW11]